MGGCAKRASYPAKGTGVAFVFILDISVSIFRFIGVSNVSAYGTDLGLG